MNAEQIKKLKELAKKVPGHPAEWPFHLNASHAAASPAVILELIAIAEKSLAAPTIAGAVLSDEQIGKLITSHGTGGWQTVESMHTFARAILAAAAPLYAASQASHPEPPRVLTHEQVREAGGIIHKDGNIFFTNLDKLNKAIALAQPEIVSDGPAGWRNGFQRLETVPNTGDAAIGEKGNG